MRVRLIAMSGVRIYNPDLLALGMTLPGFIERGNVIASLPSLGLLTIAAYLPRHWDIEYLEVDDLSGFRPAQADVVFISSLTARINDAYRVAAECRDAGAKVILGGLHASVLPDEASLHVDSIVIGEGEAVMPEIVADLEAGVLKPRYGPRSHILNESPIPRYDLLDPGKYNRITVQTQRGCPLDCEFCGASRMISAFKQKPPSQVRAELEAVKAVWPRPFIELADDNTFVNKKISREVVKEIRAADVRWFTETDISVADDESLLDDLAEAGCAQVLIGFESVSSGALHLTDSKDWKRRRRDGYLGAIERIQRKGISVNGCFVFGFDTDRVEVFEETRSFVDDSGLSEVQITLFTPFPGTRAYNRLKQEGRLFREKFWDQCTLFDLTFEPKGMTADELTNGFRNLVSDLYSVEASAERKAKFVSTMRNR